MTQHDLDTLNRAFRTTDAIWARQHRRAQFRTFGWFMVKWAAAVGLLALIVMAR